MAKNYILIILLPFFSSGDIWPFLVVFGVFYPAIFGFFQIHLGRIGGLTTILYTDKVICSFHKQVGLGC